MYTIDISVNEPQISVSNISTDITVTSDNSLFTITNQVSNFTVTNYSPVVLFTADGGNGFDFVVKHRGEWENGFEYVRNDVVRYENSIYICSINPLQTFTSTTNPKVDTTNWELFYFNEWTKSYLTITNNLSVGSSVNIGDTITADKLTVYHTGTFKDVNVSDLNVGSATINTALTIGGLKYPIQKGLYGQVLTTNGVTTATWVNLGDLVFWSLSADLFTNGHNIVSNGTSTSLTIGAGVSDNIISYVTMTDSDIIIDTPGTIYLNSPVRITGTLRGQYTTSPVQLGTGGITFGDGSIQTVAYNGLTYTLPTASATTLGGIKVGNNLTISNGVLSANAGDYTLPTASTSTLGGIKVGSNLTILNGVLNATAYTLPIASTSTLGGIKVGSNLIIDNEGVLNVNTSGGGVYTLPAATTSTLGGIKVGTGLSIDGNNKLNVSLGSIGNISLTQEMFTNGYKIKSDTFGYTYLDADVTMLTLAGLETSIQLGGGGQYDTRVLSLTNNNGDITSNTSGKVISNAPIHQIGQDVNHSKLYVEKIYNYEGTYAPNFPAGIQFGDQTVQRTAFEPDQGLLP